ncbi:MULTISPECIES: hypothetical protein [Paenibacillus]|nr:hypothetical protein [Paenibacillus macerans]MCY7558237.1 hypothetical protein [Paenibacillus macerans]MEC0154625.1 hypothetical protein [Paenibacillus macerans]SUA85643.1 Uncharacterised protein [Paenibacillus macerans]
MEETTQGERINRPITPQDWKDIEKKLHDFYDRVELICDGYYVSLVLRRYGQFRNVIAVYVNGVIEGKWWIEDCEERRRFFCPRTKDMMTKKDKADLKKISKKMLKEMEAKSKYTHYEPYWSSFRLLKSHLIKNNKVIEMVVTNANE